MTPETTPGRIDLSGPWHLADASGEYTCEASLPGDAISSLHAAGLIPEPYWGRNEYDLRWIAERDWTYSRTVTLTDAEVELVVSGLDTVAEIHWNGERVLSAENAFRTYRASLAGIARTGENHVEIRFPSNVRAAAEKQRQQPFYIPYHDGNSPIPHGNMLRKVQCDFGWDWNIALAPFGLVGGIALEPAAAPVIDAIRATQSWNADGSVDLQVTVDALRPGGGTVAATFAGETRQAVLPEGGDPATAVLSFHVEDPALWWPAGQGDQVLHDLSVTLGGLSRTRRIGLRKVELDTSPDAAGSRFAFRVNDREVFMKGANWIPADALSGRIDPAAVRDLLQSARDANMNMIRVWGGGRYEPDWFYEICDELGLMVWQDFMFACNLYPSTPDFLAEVRAEVAENVARLQHHACIALWCGDNELVGALTWFPESVKDRDRYLVNYDRLNRTIEEELRRTAPEAIWWPSSPCPGPMNFGDSWHDDGHGDMHFWSVWHEGRDFEHYRDIAPRFCSEFGFQSYPSMSAIRRFADPEDRNIAAPVFESHQKNQGGNARIAETMFRYFRWPERFEDFVWLSQIQQGLAIRTAVEHWRSLKPHCMGTLYWQLNDTWPVCSWASLDHGGNWKMLHHMAKSFHAPVHCVAVPADGGFRVVGLNDTPEAVTITVTAHATKLDGTAREIGRASAEVGAAAETLLTVDALAEDELLTLGWEGSEGTRAGDVINPLPWKAYALPDPGLAHAVRRDGDSWIIEVTAEAMAFFVTFEADIPGRFDKAAFHLGPGVTSRVTFTPADPAAEPVFTRRDLHAATMARH